MYAVTSLGPPFSKQDGVHLQTCLDAAIDDAGVVQLVKGQEPWPADLPVERIAELDRIFPRVVRLLEDARCHVFGGKLKSESDDAGMLDDDDMIIPAPLGSTSGRRVCTLEYYDLQARGFLRPDKVFVVLPGSQIRKEQNKSIIKRIRTRRRRLLAGDLTSAVVGANDRESLDVAIGFPSKAIAAKVLTGAHRRTDDWRDV